MTYTSENKSTDTPLLDALVSASLRHHAPFYTPGHKRGQGLPQRFIQQLGSYPFQADLPELPGLDNLFAPEGVIDAAQALAAEAFGATETWFLANGSTCGIQAALMAVGGEGDTVILPRNAHRCAIAGLILSGATPWFVTPEMDPQWHIPTGVPTSAIAQALQQVSASAVLLVSPTYHGLSSDLNAIAQLAHQYDIPLLVDEAHGAHFAFHPAFPTPAIAAGADLAVQSIHKTLGSLTQSAMLHLGQTSRIHRDRLVDSLALVQSSSPNYLLLASLDAARHQMATDGYDLMQTTLELADWAHDAIAQIPGLRVLTQDKMTCVYDRDRTRLTVDVTGLGLSGFEADELLHNTWGVTAELPSLHHLTFILSLGNTHEDIQALIAGLQKLSYHCESHISYSIKRSPLPPFPPAGVSLLSPRQAFFSLGRTLSAWNAIGCPSAELICPYPPGIPVLIPGEAITPDAIVYLNHIRNLGGSITGCADPSLETFRVID